MSLTITSRANTLIGRKKAWRFHVRHAGVISYDALMEEMAHSGSSALLPDMARVLMFFRQTVSRLVSDRYFVQGPLGDHYLSAVGTARNADDRFMPTRPSSGHGYRLRFRPDRSVEAGMIKGVSFKRDQNAGRRNPHPQMLEQIRAGEAAPQAADGPTVLSNGAYARLHGALLGFDPADKSLGVFLLERYGTIRSGVLPHTVRVG
jgi:hypothetical protein